MEEEVEVEVEVEVEAEVEVEVIRLTKGTTRFWRCGAGSGSAVPAVIALLTCCCFAAHTRTKGSWSARSTSRSWFSRSSFVVRALFCDVLVVL